MRIINETSGEVLASKAKPCEGMFKQALGLRFASKPKTIVFDLKKVGNFTFDMFFVFFPIDVVFLDQDKKIVDVKENFRPFRAYSPKKPFRYAIEFPMGTVSKTKTKQGHVLKF